jgi:YgiT-type zinc finger domain-containing protein
MKTTDRGTCFLCGGTTRVSRKDHRYTVGGGWYVTIERNEHETCQKCGEEYVSIFAATKLDRAIAAEIVRKPGLLAPPEVRFLVDCFENMNGSEMAAALGIARETLSRYMQGSYRINPTVDRLLRMLVADRYLHDNTHALVPLATLGHRPPLDLTFVLERGEYRLKHPHRAAA